MRVLGIFSDLTTDRVLIEDGIILLRNCAVDSVGCLDNGIKVFETSRGLVVSASIYQWALSVNLLITDKGQVERMLEAIEININNLQSNIGDLRIARDAYNKEACFGFERPIATYKRLILGAVERANGGVVQADWEIEKCVAVEEEKYTFQNHCERFVEPLLDKYHEISNKVWLGSHSVHPNLYLQNLGLKKLRFTAITPLYL
jgi:hypothetical protein